MNRAKQLGILAGLGTGATMLIHNGVRERRRANQETKPENDHMLAARVAAEIDDAVPHGRGIQVIARNSYVTLRGVALRDEVCDVINAARRIRGIKDLVINLEIKSRPGKVLALQN